MKKIYFALLALLITLILTGPVMAAAQLKLTLSPVHEYQKSTDFRLYYAYLETEGNQATVNLYVQKEGGTWRQTKDRNKTQVSGYFQIEGADIYDGDGKYNFYAQGKTASLTENSVTVSVIIDRKSPEKVTDYKKERVGETAYRLSWTNPDDDDFYRVFIYRSQDKSFTADSGTKVGEAGGTPGEKMTWENSSLEKNTTYYYALRVIDRAGNSSSLVTDAPGEVIEGEVTDVGEEIVGAIAESETVLLTEEERLAQESITSEEGEQEEGTLSDEGLATTGQEGEVMGEKDNQVARNRLLIIVPLVIVVVAAAFFFFRKRVNQ
ncbi:MAG: hypothetical protein PHX72_01615 [Candidatus Shapirobacteria bacterium]|nr:hypothetical protein [Candidatus Shapirobacteria bacterium]